MNKTEQRQVALEAARGQMRKMSIVPETQTAHDALDVLDDRLRKDPSLVASEWYRHATSNQIKLFTREWQRWRAKKVGAMPVIQEIEDAIPPLVFEKHGNEVYDIEGDAGIMDPGEYFEQWFASLDVPDGTEFVIKGSLPSWFIVRQL